MFLRLRHFSAESTELAGACRRFVYPGMLPWTSLRMRRRLGGRPLTGAQQRAVATNIYAAGANRISVYNHSRDDWKPPLPPNKRIERLKQAREEVKQLARQREKRKKGTVRRLAPAPRIPKHGG